MVEAYPNSNTFTLMVEKGNIRKGRGLPVAYQVGIYIDENNEAIFIVHDAMDMSTGSPPRRPESEERLVEALESLRWSVESDPDLEDEQRESVLVSLFGSI